MGITFRPLTERDDNLLVRATLGNMNWSEPRFTREEVVSRPEFAHYTRFSVARGDFGIVAERQARPIGVVWALFLTADDPGYGYVDGLTPEVSLWVHDDERGHGLGRRLLRALFSESAHRGHERLSLSVEPGNHAWDLYASEGFIPVPGCETDGVMVRDTR